ncbi:hypothetical protein V6N12_015761 [Hibiscus sabdariffa]|uniref:40S ribosomal protein S30 n=1 Tax=Hibiscus sabdariffa TaxID=183260 RepID=A0ABR2DP47_9ROSI
MPKMTRLCTNPQTGTNPQSGRRHWSRLFYGNMLSIVGGPNRCQIQRDKNPGVQQQGPSFDESAMGKVHGSLARAGKVRGQTPKVAKQDKKKKPRGRAYKRMQYNRRFVTAVVGFGKKRGPNSSEK